MSDTKQNIHEKTDTIEEIEERPNDPPPYSNPPVTNQPQMSVVCAQGAVGSIGTVGMVGQQGMMTAVAPGFIVLNQMVYEPTPFECKSCHQQIVTKVKRKPTFKTHFFAAGFCLMCFLPCAIIPYYTNGCKQADHYCPNCDTFIGSYIP